MSISGVANNVKEMCHRPSSWARSRHCQLVPVCSILLTHKILLNASLQAASTKRLELEHESKAVCSPFQLNVSFCSRRNKPREKKSAAKPVKEAGSESSPPTSLSGTLCIHTRGAGRGRGSVGHKPLPFAGSLLSPPAPAPTECHQSCSVDRIKGIP